MANRIASASPRNWSARAVAIFFPRCDVTVTVKSPSALHADAMSGTARKFCTAVTLVVRLFPGPMAVTAMSSAATCWFTPGDTPVTVKVVLPITVSLVADTVVEPTPAVVAKPFEPAALLTVAIVLSEDAQVTWVVRSCVELSL